MFKLFFAVSLSFSYLQAMPLMPIEGCQKAMFPASSFRQGETITIGTEHPSKVKEFTQLSKRTGISVQFEKYKYREIDDDPHFVAIHKASQLGERDFVILSEDTSLFIEGTTLGGVNIKHVMDHMSDYIGRKAVWMSHISIYRYGVIYVYKGAVEGRIVAKEGDEGALNYFLPNGAKHTVGGDRGNPRFSAHARSWDSLLANRPVGIFLPIHEWNGKWQKD